jgi:intracellular septation protein A
MRLYSHYSFLLHKHGYFTDYPPLRTDAKIRRNLYDCPLRDLFPPPMKILSDLLAVILFFITYTLTKNIIWATAVALAAGVVQAIFTYIKNKKLETMQWVSLILIVVLGGATILLKDQRFIMWKPTALFWFGALALAVGQIMGKNSLKSLMGKELELPDLVWRKLTFAWIGYLLFMGIANIIVFKNFTEAQWVSYKLFGSTALMIVFVIGQGLYLSRYLPRENN